MKPVFSCVTLCFSGLKSLRVDPTETGEDKERGKTSVKFSSHAETQAKYRLSVVCVCCIVPCDRCRAVT